MKPKPRIILADIFLSEFFTGMYGEVHLGLLQIGSLLKSKGYEVYQVGLIDDRFELLRAYIDKNTLCIGMTVMTAQIKRCLELSRWIKNNYPYVKIIWGGIHPTMFPTQPMEEKNVDVSIFGDGEYSMLEVCNAFRDNTSLKDIKGIFWRDENIIIENEPREYTDISKLPVNDYSIVVNLEKYIRDCKYQSNVHDNPFLTISGGTGCPFQCTFCINPTRKRRSIRSVKQMLEEIEWAIKNYKVEYFRINDELFFSDVARLKEFLKEQKKRKLKFYWETSYHVKLIKDENFYTDKFLLELKKYGWIGGGVGGESGSIEQLKRYKKGITPEDIIKAAERIERIGVKTNFSFVIGSPDESYEDMIQTIRLCYNIKVAAPFYSMIQYPQIYRPYPLAELYPLAVKKGYKERFHLKEWVNVSPQNGFTSYHDLPYIDTEKIFALLYSFKFFKGIFKAKPLIPLLRWHYVSMILKSRTFIVNGGKAFRGIVEVPFLDKYVYQPIFHKTLINKT